MELKAVGVVGAGVIGTGLAQDLAQSGHDVVLVDVSDDALDRSLRAIRRDARVHHVVSGTGDRIDAAAVLKRIDPSTDIRDLRAVEFVVENVTEDWATKRAVHEAIDRACPPRCVVAANTSAIPIARIAEVTARREQVLGMHFMNPVPLKPVVEVVRSVYTSDDALTTAETLLGQMGKRGVVVRDSPGFVSNRVLMLTINEAVRVLEDDVANPHEVDDIFRSCFGHAMGPLETADLIGLDTVLRTLDVLVDAFRDARFDACPLLRSMVAGGLLGRKSGEGFYRYAARPHGEPER